MSRAGRPWPPLVCLGKGNGTRARCWRGRWRDDVTADWERLVSDELEATRVPILRKRSSHQNGSVESCRDGSVLFLLLGLLLVDLLLCFRLLRVALLRGERGRGEVSTDGAHGRPPRRDCAARHLHGASHAEHPLLPGAKAHRRTPSRPPPLQRSDPSRTQPAGFVHCIFLLSTLEAQPHRLYDILSHPPEDSKAKECCDHQG